VNKPRKIRTDFRKNRTERPRRTDWTRKFASEGASEQDHPQEERIGKSEQSRKRTVVGCDQDSGDEPDLHVLLDVDESCLRGRVLGVYGLTSEVRSDEGHIYQCATRRLLKTLTTDQRHVVAAGDIVLFRPVPLSDPQNREGIIERIEPRRGSICRATRGRMQVLVTNVDQLLIVSSAAEPRLKPNLIDRLLVAAEKGRVEPIICINKVDLIDPAALQPLVGDYSQMGYQVLLLSAKTGIGMDRLRRVLAGRESVLSGQSGVGKSSLLNVIEPGLDLAVQEVSVENQKGKHTTTTARLLPLSSGGYVVDTPGIRQFQPWDVIQAEVAGYYRDLRPFVSQCRFPDCTHTHEDDCAVKHAMADGLIDERRYESYCHLSAGEMD